MPVESAILGIDHIQITIPVGAEDQARAFYCAMLGLVEIPKPTSLNGRGGFWLECGGLQVHVGTEPEWDRRQTKAHVAYRVTDLDVWRTQLTDAGYSIEESVPISGFDRLETRDPFGNRLEFIEVTSARGEL